jgi:glycerol-3-phosphate dehydrogenase
VITQDQPTDGKLINIFGGKITTYRKLAEEVLTLVDQAAKKKTEKWTAHAALPGGDFPAMHFDQLVTKAATDFPFVEPVLLARLARLYGTHLWLMLADCENAQDLGQHFGASLYQVEVDFLAREEWARRAEDIVFRRTKLGLRMQPEEIDALQAYLDQTPVVQGIPGFATDLNSAQMS